MPTLVKKVDKTVPVAERYQKFVGYTDFGTGDLIDVEASLGRPASETTIVCGSGDTITVRFNAVHVLYPEVNDNQFQGDRGGERRFDYDSPVLVEDESQTEILVGNDEVFTFDRLCRNIRVIAATGSPEITVV